MQKISLQVIMNYFFPRLSTNLRKHGLDFESPELSPTAVSTGSREASWDRMEEHVDAWPRTDMTGKEVAPTGAKQAKGSPLLAEER